MRLRKSRLNFALQAALVGAAVAALPTIATADPTGGEEEDQGNAILFPYYTANGGWATLVNLTNTSDAYLALKIRFREQENSRDVLDFNVVMSPKDVWTGWVAEGPNGPRFHTRDTSCTSPILDKDDGVAYADFSSVAYTGSSADGGSTGIERAAEGHLEVFVMGGIPRTLGEFWPGGSSEPDYPTAYWSDHRHMDCSIVDSNFKVDSGPGTGDYRAVEPSEDNHALNTYQDALAGNPQARVDFPRSFPDPLLGHVSYINTGRGVGAGGNAYHIANFFDRGNLCAHPSDYRPRIYNCNNNMERNLVTAQEYPYFLEPTLGSAGGLWTYTRALEYSEETYSEHVVNEWSVNPATGAATDWIVSFPNKYLNVDIADDLQAGVNLVRLAYTAGREWWPGDPCSSGVGGYTCGDGDTEDNLVDALASGEVLGSVLYPFSEPFDGQSCDEVVFNLWDREENGVAGSGTSISPAPPVPTSSLCYETNVLTFGGAKSVLNSRLAQTVDVSGLTSGASAGWMHLEIPQADTDDRWRKTRPVTGFALKERNFGDPMRNYGQMMNHSLTEPRDSFPNSDPNP